MTASGMLESSAFFIITIRFYQSHLIHPSILASDALFFSVVSDGECGGLAPVQSSGRIPLDWELPIEVEGED